MAIDLKYLYIALLHYRKSQCLEGVVDLVEVHYQGNITLLDRSKDVLSQFYRPSQWEVMITFSSNQEISAIHNQLLFILSTR